MVEEYGWNFKSLWDMVEAFGGSPGIHKGLTDSILVTTVTQVGLQRRHRSSRRERN
jgi:hypothetical protein